MSTYTNYLGQVHNKVFNKTSHRQVKIFKNITNCHYDTIKTMSHTSH